MPEFEHKQFPLKKIFLRNSKSVKEAEIQISPLTVVVGANSSGKSTLLQSVLSLAQATSKDKHGTNFPFNGEKIRLGTFAETKSFFVDSNTEPIQIGFELEIEQSETNFLGGRLRNREQSSFSTSIKFELNPSGSINVGSAEVTAIDIEVERDSEIGSSIAPQFIKSSLKFSADQIGSGGRSGIRECTGTTFDSLTSEAFSVARVEFRGLFPTILSERIDTSKILAGIIWDAIHDVLKDQVSRQKRDAEQNRPANDEVLLKVVARTVEIVRPIIELFEETTEIDYSDYLTSLRERIDKLTPSRKKALAECGAWSSIESISEELIKSSGLPFIEGESFRQRTDQIADTLSAVARLTQILFRHRTTYLGPIRETPKVNYDPNTTRSDVGPRGEYTAFVLNEIGRTRYLVPLADGTEQRVALISAVNNWLQFFGLANQAKTVDNGRLGIGLSLSLINGGHEVDLTSVGVGVSQVLPVIVACLMAKPGSITLIEQPELHLHPKLQMDLADFLLACCKSGRQLIIETHSEHLVNRLRRRIAEDESGATKEIVGILFAEQKDGITRYQSPAITDFGGIGSDWPDGFLDIGAGEAESLIEAGMSKMQRSADLG